jgi:hypothetical protein
MEYRSEMLSSNASYVEENAPDFSKLVSDILMRKVLGRRWNEIVVCFKNKACLAMIVLSGSLLEALFLARINQYSDKKRIFTASSAPKDKNGQTQPLNRWTLNDYIAVAFELKWISHSAKEVSVVFRDFRNFIHPEKEISSGHEIGEQDIQLLWPIFKTLVEQIINN